MVVNALLDDVNTKTYINEDVTAKLRLKGPAQQFQINILNGHSELLETCLFKWN